MPDGSKEIFLSPISAFHALNVMLLLLVCGISFLLRHERRKNIKRGGKVSVFFAEFFISQKK